MNSQFVTVFEVCAKPINWQPLIICAIFCIVGLGIVVQKWRSEERTKYLFAGVIFCIVAFIVGFGSYRRDTYGIPEAAQALREGRVSTIEGRVTDFVPMPYGGHPDEQFTVSGVRFSYSDYFNVPCFNNSSSHGGPIREGLWVRLSYRGNCILKIEVWKPPAAAH
jgi:hypothetical protein